MYFRRWRKRWHFKLCRGTRVRPVSVGHACLLLFAMLCVIDCLIYKHAVKGQSERCQRLSAISGKKGMKTVDIFFPFCVLLRFISLIGQRRWLQDNDVYGRERNSFISPARYWPIRLTGTLSIRKVNIITENVCNLHVFNKCSLPGKSELCYYEAIVYAKVLNFTYLHYIWLYMCWRQWIYRMELIVKR